MVLRSAYWDVMSARGTGQGRKRGSGRRDEYGLVDELSRTGSAPTLVRFVRDRSTVAFARANWGALRALYQREMDFVVELLRWCEGPGREVVGDQLGAVRMLDRKAVDAASRAYYAAHGLEADPGLAGVVDWEELRVARGWGPEDKDSYLGAFHDLNDTRGWPEGYAGYVKDSFEGHVQPRTPDWFVGEQAMGVTAFVPSQRKAAADAYIAETSLLRARMDREQDRGAPFEVVVYGAEESIVGRQMAVGRKRPQRRKSGDQDQAAQDGGEMCNGTEGEGQE